VAPSLGAEHRRLRAARWCRLAATGGTAYIGYVLQLTLMVGAIQIGAALLRAGSLFDFVSTTIILAIAQAVAITILVSVGGLLLGPASGNDAPLWSQVMNLFARLSETSPDFSPGRVAKPSRWCDDWRCGVMTGVRSSERVRNPGQTLGGDRRDNIAYLQILNTSSTAVAVGAARPPPAC